MCVEAVTFLSGVNLFFTRSTQRVADDISMRGSISIGLYCLAAV